MLILVEAGNFRRFADTCTKKMSAENDAVH